jgi:hypothetical protein
MLLPSRLMSTVQARYTIASASFPLADAVGFGVDALRLHCGPIRAGLCARHGIMLPDPAPGNEQPGRASWRADGGRDMRQCV